MSLPEPVVCEPSPRCCFPSAPFYGQGISYLNAQTGFLLTCPPGFSCDAGFYPTPIIVPRGTIPFTPPPGISPLRFTCCDGSVEVRYLPDGFTQAQFAAAAQSIANAAAAKLALCEAAVYNRQHARPATCTITTASPLPSGDIGTPYSQALAVTGLTGTVTWSLLGTLPPGLSLSGAGVISGTPTGSPASYAFPVRARSATGTACVKLFSVTINDCASADWCVDPGTCRLRVKDFNAGDWTLVWDGNLNNVSAFVPPCVGYFDDTGFVGLNWSVGQNRWRFSILCPDLSVYLAAGPIGASPLGIYTFDVSSDPACVGPASFEIEGYVP